MSTTTRPQEEGGYEYASDHQPEESSGHEPRFEPTVLYQPLEAGADQPDGEEDDGGVLHYIKGGPGVCAMSGGKHCKAGKIWHHAGSAGPSIEQEAGRFWREVKCGVEVVGQLGAEETTVGGAMVEHGELKRRGEC